MILSKDAKPSQLLVFCISHQWLIAVILILMILRQVLPQFEANLGYIERSCLRVNK